MSNFWLQLIEDQEEVGKLADALWAEVGNKTMTMADYSFIAAIVIPDDVYHCVEKSTPVGQNHGQMGYKIEEIYLAKNNFATRRPKPAQPVSYIP